MGEVYIENEYEVIANLNEETKKIYEKLYNSAKYDLLMNSEDMILAKKTNTDVDKEKEEIVILTKAIVEKININSIT